jgi:hypothetical protein
MSRRKLEQEIDDLREEVNMLDNMLSSLVDVLEEKGLLTHEEWERKIKQKLSSK